MSECLCKACHPSPHVSHSQEYMLEMEAKLLLTWPLARRREYLAHHNVAGRCEVLKAEIMRLWDMK